MYLHVPVLPFLLLSWLLLAAARPTPATNTTANIAAVTDSSFFVSKHDGCQPKCGSVTVPYPFGIGSDCSIGPWFNITCDNSSGHPKPYIGDKDNNTFEVLFISQTQVWTPILFIYECYNETGGLTTNNSFGPDLFLFHNGFGINLDNFSFPYSISHTANKVTTVGCNDLAVLLTSDTRGFSGEIGGCLPSCWGGDFTTNYNGFGCYQSDIPRGDASVYSLGSVEPTNVKSCKIY